MTPDEAAPNGHALSTEDPPATEGEEPHIVNGNVSRVETERLPQVICCSEVIDVFGGDVSFAFILLLHFSLLPALRTKILLQSGLKEPDSLN